MERKMKFAIILTLIFFLFVSPVFSENKTSQVNLPERIEIFEYEKVVAVNGFVRSSCDQNLTVWKRISILVVEYQLIHVWNAIVGIKHSQTDIGRRWIVIAYDQSVSSCHRMQIFKN